MSVCVVEIPAKINLSLAVVGKRGSLHELDSIIAPYDKLKDRVTFVRDDGACGIEVEYADCYDGFKPDLFDASFRLVVTRLADALGGRGKLVVSKRIPLGMGLGGSSAPVAAAARAMAQNSRLEPQFLVNFGSDVPAMYVGGVLRMRGIGEQIEPLKCDRLPEFEVVLSEGGCDSGECYRLFDKMGNNGGKIPQSADEALELLRNDLFLPACILNPSIKATADRLRAEGKRFCMTGSGGAFYTVKAN